MLAGELPYAELATSAAIAGSLAGVELKAIASSSNHIGELTWPAKPDAGIRRAVRPIPPKLRHLPTDLDQLSASGYQPRHGKLLF